MGFTSKSSSGGALEGGDNFTSLFQVLQSLYSKYQKHPFLPYELQPRRGHPVKHCLIISVRNFRLLCRWPREVMSGSATRSFQSEVFSFMLEVGSHGPGKLPDEGKSPKVVRGGCKRSFGPREQKASCTGVEWGCRAFANPPLLCPHPLPSFKKMQSLGLVKRIAGKGVALVVPYVVPVLSDLSRFQGCLVAHW